MPSTATSRNRLEKQGSGENLNAWGVRLNTALDLIDAMADGCLSFTLSGSKTLTSANYVTDEARNRALNITGGTGGTVTIPGVQKTYLIRNNSSGNVVFTTGGGATATIEPGLLTFIMCDGSNVYGMSFSAYVAAAQGYAQDAEDAAAAAALSEAAAALSASQANTAKAGAETARTGAEAARDLAEDYRDQAQAALLPSQAGHAGKILTTDGTNPSWQIVATWQQIASTTTAGVSVWEFASLGAYTDILVVFNLRLSAGTGVGVALNLHGVTNASWHASNVSIGTFAAGATGDNLLGSVFLPGYRKDRGVAFGGVKSATGDDLSTSATNFIGFEWAKAGGVDQLRIALTGTGPNSVNSNGHLLTVYGK